MVFRPLAGCGLFPAMQARYWLMVSFRPLAGCGLFRPRSATGSMPSRFPSPCGVWVVSVRALPPPRAIRGFRPLAGCGLFPKLATNKLSMMCFRPLAGCGLFLQIKGNYFYHGVSVPLRGVGCFADAGAGQQRRRVSVPLRGVGCFAGKGADRVGKRVSVPLRGVGCFGKAAHSFWCNRKKNCQLCYFIVSYWQMFINSKLRNCKVPCEAHKTAT